VTPETNGSGPVGVAETAVAGAAAPVTTTAFTPVLPRPARPRMSRALWIRLTILGVLLVVLGAAAGLGVAGLTPTVYAAHADVLYLLSREQPTGFLREDRNLSTQLVLLKSRTVLQPVADDWHRPIDDVTRATDAVVLQESEDIRVQFVDTDPDRARRMLEAIVARYLAVSNNDERADLRNYLDGELRDILTQESQVRGEGQARAAQMGPLVDREQWLRRQLDELKLNDLAGPAARVLVAPYVESDPVSPRPLVATGAGALAGLLVALLAVAAVSRRRVARQGRAHRPTRS
jgi:uncharacterized protein involved in exopolysaccharide biosynthesis